MMPFILGMAGLIGLFCIVDSLFVEKNNSALTVGFILFAGSLLLGFFT